VGSVPSSIHHIRFGGDCPERVARFALSLVWQVPSGCGVGASAGVRWAPSFFSFFFSEFPFPFSGADLPDDSHPLPALDGVACILGVFSRKLICSTVCGWPEPVFGAAPEPKGPCWSFARKVTNEGSWHSTSQDLIQGVEVGSLHFSVVDSSSLIARKRIDGSPGFSLHSFRVWFVRFVSH